MLDNTEKTIVNITKQLDLQKKLWRKMSSKNTTDNLVNGVEPINDIERKWIND